MRCVAERGVLGEQRGQPLHHPLAGAARLGQHIEVHLAGQSRRLSPCLLQRRCHARPAVVPTSPQARPSNAGERVDDCGHAYGHAYGHACGHACCLNEPRPPNPIIRPGRGSRTLVSLAVLSWTLLQAGFEVDHAPCSPLHPPRPIQSRPSACATTTTPLDRPPTPSYVSSVLQHVGDEERRVWRQGTV